MADPVVKAIRLERTQIGNYLCPDDPGEATSGPGDKRRSVTDEEAGLLAQAARGKAVIEVGTGLGVSTKAMASTASSVLTIDPDEWVRKEVVPDLPSNVGHLSTLEMVGTPMKGAFGMAFIDGDHMRCAKDIRTVWPWLCVGARVYMHDFNLPSVFTNMDLEIKHLDTGCAMVYVIKPPEDMQSGEKTICQKDTGT